MAVDTLITTATERLVECLNFRCCSLKCPWRTESVPG